MYMIYFMELNKKSSHFWREDFVNEFKPFLNNERFINFYFTMNLPTYKRSSSVSNFQ